MAGRQAQKLEGNAARTAARREATAARDTCIGARSTRRAALAIGVSIALAAGTAFGAAVEQEGMRYEDSVRIDGTKAVLNGVGVRGGALFKAYVAGLYLAKKASDPEQVFAAPGAKRIAVRMLLAVDGGLLAKTFADGIRKNYKDDALDALRDRMDAFDAQVRALGGVAKGDEIDLDYVPSSGTRIVVNGKPRGTPIAGDDFYTALLKMFIGERAVDKGLRAALLGLPG